MLYACCHANRILLHARLMSGGGSSAPLLQNRMPPCWPYSRATRARLPDRLRDSPLHASRKGCELRVDLAMVPSPGLNSCPALPPTPASFYLTGKHKYATTTHDRTCMKEGIFNIPLRTDQASPSPSTRSRTHLRVQDARDLVAVSFIQ